MLLKPRFGSRMWSGIWPPSKPAIDTPERDLAPFWPRPAVLPSPEPMPRPTRTRDWRAPLLSLISLSFMLCTRFRFCRAVERMKLGRFDVDQMLNLLDLAADLGRVVDFDRAAELVQPEADERRALGLVAADRRSGLGDLDLGHPLYSVTASAWASASAAPAPPRPSRSATFLPRRCDTERGLVCSFSASKVARTML